VGEPEASAARGSPPEGDRSVTPLQVRIPTLVIVRVALAIWMVALVVLWTVPALSTGERSWWPWVPVAGLAVGLFGHVYVARGRGHASGS